MDRIYERVIDQILDSLEKGVVPWRKTWKGVDGPFNPFTKRYYTGINRIILGTTKYDSPYFMGFDQAQKMGGFVKRGEHGIQILKYSKVVKKVIDDNGEEQIQTKVYPMTLTVFNLSQIQGIEIAEEENKNNKPIEAADMIIKGMPNPPKINEQRTNKAAYSPSRDTVIIPKLTQFETPEAYYNTLFHEVVHATGHESRLNRQIKNSFGDINYSQEELIAEMGAACLCNVVGIENVTIENSISYVQSWASAIRNDKHLIFKSATQSKRACDYILNKNEKAI
jgi:antirestriction protein ArdC